MATLNCNYVMQIIALFLCVTILHIKIHEVWPFAAKAFDGRSFSKFASCLHVFGGNWLYEA